MNLLFEIESMNYVHSTNSSSNEDELDKLMVIGRYQDVEPYEYEYINSRVNYDSDEDDDEDNTFTRVSADNQHETSRDKFDRSFSRLDFQNNSQIEFHDDNLHKFYNLTFQQFTQLKAFYDEFKSSNGLFDVKLLNDLLTSKLTD